MSSAEVSGSSRALPSDDLHGEADAPGAEKKWIPPAARGFVLAALLVVPVRILVQGYLPDDDALRHAAKAVSGRDWSEILLLRPEITLDPHPGWHAILGVLHRGLGLPALDLVLLSVIGLFVLHSLGPVLLLRRPESWLVALALLCVADPVFVWRLVLGRPYLLVSAIVPLVCLLWPNLQGPRPGRALAFFAACAALTTWIHHSFYLLALPVLGLLGARAWRAGLRLAGAFAVGIVLGALLTGHPVAHLRQALLLGYLASALPKPAALVAYEFRPFEGRPLVVAGFLALLAWRARRERGAFAPLRDPAVIMAVCGWALGFESQRFYVDWAAPALLALAAVELQHALQERLPARTAAHLGGAAAATVLVVLVTGADVQGRWSDTTRRISLVRTNPAHAEWFPEPGGIAYNTEMLIFYQLFFRNPDGPWKYVLGFEPAMMLPEDYRVYSEIWTRGAVSAYVPWLQRLRPQDRLYVRSTSGTPPNIPSLEWHGPMPYLWVGRLPRNPG